MSENDSSITRALRLVTLVELIVLLVAGAGTYFLPTEGRTVWPWELLPFNSAFLGAIYLSSVPSIGMVALTGRWAPTRIVLPMVGIFTGIVLVISLIDLQRFQFARWSTWAWFLIYVVIPLNCALHVYLYRRRPPDDAVPTAPFWQLYLRVQGVVLALYGVALLAAPAYATEFWPWKIDAFHARLYSSPFFAMATGGWLVSTRAARLEGLAQALTQLCFGVLVILGLFRVDALVHRVDFSRTGTWGWLAAFLIFALSGLGMLLPNTPGKEVQLNRARRVAVAGD
jgi:hypothetical protein